MKLSVFSKICDNLSRYETLSHLFLNSVKKGSAVERALASRALGISFALFAAINLIEFFSHGLARLVSQFVYDFGLICTEFGV